MDNRESPSWKYVDCLVAPQRRFHDPMRDFVKRRYVDVVITYLHKSRGVGLMMIPRFSLWDLSPPGEEAFMPSLLRSEIAFGLALRDARGCTVANILDMPRHSTQKRNIGIDTGRRLNADRSGRVQFVPSK
jgi:hypothetical protein